MNYTKVFDSIKQVMNPLQTFFRQLKTQPKAQASVMLEQHQTVGSLISVWCVAWFVVACVYLIGWALASDSAWMLPEAFIWKSQIMQDIASGSWSTVFQRTFDVQLFEYSPRCTRPLASVFEIIDTVFRSLLWKWLIPHPSLSLSWVLTLGISPFLMYRILLDRGLPASAAFGCIGVYLTQMGTLSNTVVLFRSAKPVALFFLLLCWFLAEKLRREKFSRRRYALLLSSLFVSFLFDESTLLSYLLVGLLLASTLFKRPMAAFLFTIPLFCYLATIFKIFPWLSSMQGFAMHNQQQIALRGYGDYLNLNGLLSPELFLTVAWNSWVMLRESFCLFNPTTIPSLMSRCIIVLHLCVSTFLVIIGAWNIATKKFAKRPRENRPVLPPIVEICGYGLIALTFHGLLMSLVANQVWGPYYYGAYFGVIVTLFTAELWKQGIAIRVLACGWMGTLILASLTTFPAMNAVYKRFHYYPYQPLEIRDYFTGKANRFSLPPLSMQLPINSLRELAAHDWSRQDVPVRLAKEQLWVVIERGGLISAGTFPNTELAQSWNFLAYDVNRHGFWPVTMLQ